MKRLIICMLAFLLVYTNGTAQTVTVADVEALPGETVTFVLNLSGGKADTYTSLQFDAEFPSGFTTTGDYSISPKWKNASAVVGDVIDGVATVPVSSAEVITGADVEGLFSVDFKVDESVALGDYDVTLRKITFGYGFTDKDIAADVTFTVHVVSTHTIVLDENSTTAPEAAEDVKVRVLRTINAGEWSTICLPFALTEPQCKEAFGNDVKIGDFTGYDTQEDAEESVVGISVNFKMSTSIEANHPYIIKVSAPVSEFSVEGVNIEPEDVPCVSYGTTTGKGKNAVYHPVDFTGTYVADFDFYNDATSTPLFLNGNKFYYATEKTKHMKAFRGYFDFDDILSNVESASARVSISFDDESTGIDAALNVDGELVKDKFVFNLHGQRVGAVRHGLYVREGKIFMVK